MLGKRILLVDDEHIVAESVRMILSVDYDVVYVDSAAEAIRLYEPGKFAVVITDHRMPEMTGLELAEHLKSVNRAQPILMLTGYPPNNAHAVVDLVLVKPFGNAALREAVGRLASNGSR